MSQYKKQHYVPESYLKAWCDPNSPENYEPYVWVFSKDTYRGKPKAPTNIFFERDLYTIEIKGERDLSIEKSLAQIENEFVNVRKNILERHKPLSLSDKITICAFSAAMYSRTLASEGRWKPVWEEAENKMKLMLELAKTDRPTTLEDFQLILPGGKQHIVSYDGIKKIGLSRF